MQYVLGILVRKEDNVEQEERSLVGKYIGLLLRVRIGYTKYSRIRCIHDFSCASDTQFVVLW